MSSNLMRTEAGGEQTQYEGEATHTQPHKKSGGQLGEPETTTDPSQTAEGQQARAERAARTTENIRYGQTLSEGGMGGKTTDASGEAAQEGYGRLEDQPGDSDAAQSRKVQGYGGERDMNREVGA